MVNKQAQQAVQQTLDSVTSDPKAGIAGVVFVAVDKNGDHIAAVPSGKRGIAKSDPMDLDTVFWIASCTKMVCTIACMQAVERGLLSLDDAKQVHYLCPELNNKKVLQDDGTLVDRNKDITLRMLLSHTAGFAYEFFNEKLKEHGRPVGYDVFHGDAKDILRMPLVHQPGEAWEYGTNIDWAGIVLERATGVRLNDWIQENIMAPLDLHSVNMLPTADMKRNLAYMHQKWPGSSLKTEERDHILREPLLAETAEEKAKIFHSAGAGLFAKPVEYVQVLAALLNDGKSPKTGARILQKGTVDLMWENQIPQFPNFARQAIPDAKREQTNPIPQLYPQEGDPPQGWGLSMMLTQEPGGTGRGRNTGWWAGLANLFWWCDRERGVAGMIATQTMPFCDPNVLGAWVNCESAVYASV
ncbi:Putative beta-lactamase/transpeptidase [Septoria linicola]|uniref:Beta-lactamase/transpeptidase n=1 Tax=Septoria linicola TaxID=215465 RepID=A0A9Q9ATZ1_9PEZI|nr:putative beta-lactamase/transpeptidase [Septoria linicola]USW53153.1 Putative beta-lactamase/transpeptidase [Septoria linicola]